MAPRKKADMVADPAPLPAKRGRKPSAKAGGDFDELSSLASEVKELEDERRAESGGNNSWLRLLNSGVDEITKGTAKYIKGAEAGDYFLSEKGILLKDPELTVLGIFKVYAEKKPGAKKADGAKNDEMDITVSFWLPQDAEQVPLRTGDNFRRDLSNGNYLQPMHWMFVYIHDHPEVKDALIPFQSKGNSYCAEIAKLLKKSSAMSAELRLKFSSTPERNEDWNKTYFYPTASIAGHNFHYNSETGKISAAEDGLDADEIKEILTRANEAQKAYKDLKMVSKRSEQQLLALTANAGVAGAKERKGLPGSRGSYKDEDDGEAPVKF